jgi:hypothetical protein
MTSSNQQIEEKSSFHLSSLLSGLCLAVILWPWLLVVYRVLVTTYVRYYESILAHPW